jgi:hypothetical protein
MLKVGEYSICGDCAKHGKVKGISIDPDGGTRFFICEKCFYEVLDELKKEKWL